MNSLSAARVELATKLPGCFPVPVTLALALVYAAAGADWPQWLGPNRDAISTEYGSNRLLAQPVRLWTNNVGVSSLVVSGGKVFTMGHAKGPAKRGIDTVFCLTAATGEVRWRYSYDCRTCVSQDVQFDGPRSTPTVDGDRVYALSLEGHLFALEAASGTVAWSRQLTDDFGGRIPIYGYCCSPLVYDDLLLLEVNAPDASHVALDKRTGDLVWKATGLNVTCASPVLMRTDGWDCAVFLGSDAVLGADPRTGRTLWRHGTWGHAWMGQLVHSNLVFADASPSGYRETARHALLDGRSWTVPALADGRLFVRNNAGAVACYQLIAP